MVSCLKVDTCEGEDGTELVTCLPMSVWVGSCECQWCLCVSTSKWLDSSAPSRRRYAVTDNPHLIREPPSLITTWLVKTNRTVRHE